MRKFELSRNKLWFKSQYQSFFLHKNLIIFTFISISILASLSFLHWYVSQSSINQIWEQFVSLSLSVTWPWFLYRHHYYFGVLTAWISFTLFKIMSWGDSVLHGLKSNSLWGPLFIGKDFSVTNKIWRTFNFGEIGLDWRYMKKNKTTTTKE